MSTPPIRTVGVVGAGAMGAMYAAHLAAGVRVLLVAQGDRARRLRQPGLVVNGTPLRAEVVDLADLARADPAPVADLVIVAVKDGQLAEAVEQVAPLVGEHTTFLSVLNGLDSEEVIAARYGPERVLLCIALGMDAMREGPQITYTRAGRLHLGPMDASHPVDRLAAVRAVLDRAGLANDAPEDIRHEMWWKFMVNVGINQASAVVRGPYGAFNRPGPARSLMLALIDEVIAVSGPAGVPLGPADVAAWEDLLAGMPPEGWTSMLQDVVAGRPTEVEIFGGRVVSLGEQHGIPTPVNRTVTWILRGLTEVAGRADARPDE